MEQKCPAQMPSVTLPHSKETLWDSFLATEMYVEVTEWNLLESFQKGLTQLAFSHYVLPSALTLFLPRVKVPCLEVQLSFMTMNVNPHLWTEEPKDGRSLGRS